MRKYGNNIFLNEEFGRKIYYIKLNEILDTMRKTECVMKCLSTFGFCLIEGVEGFQVHWIGLKAIPRILIFKINILNLNFRRDLSSCLLVRCVYKTKNYHATEIEL